jgi:hypothetical protein
MIQQKTAREIYNCYSDIVNSEKLLEEIAKIEERIEAERKEASHRNDLSERYEMYELGVPDTFSSERNRSMRIFRMKPTLAKSVIIAHRADQKARLAELNEIAKIECSVEQEEENVTEKS